MKDTVMKRV